VKFLALALLAACDFVSGPAFYAGPASISAVVPAGVDDTLRVLNQWTGQLLVAHPGDSLCMSFSVDGNAAASFWISNNNIPMMLLDWYPSAFNRHVTITGLGGGIYRGNWRAALC